MGFLRECCCGLVSFKRSFEFTKEAYLEELFVYPEGLPDGFGTEPDGMGVETDPDGPGPIGVVLFDGKQVPSPFGFPLSHLQDFEHPSPSTVLPSSHSSPRAGSQCPSPHPAGVAPRVMMYGRPLWPPANCCVPGATTPSAIAMAWKPLIPVDGYAEKASWTEQLQLER